MVEFINSTVAESLGSTAINISPVSSTLGDMWIVVILASDPGALDFPPAGWVTLARGLTSFDFLVIYKLVDDALEVATFSSIGGATDLACYSYVYRNVSGVDVAADIIHFESTDGSTDDPHFLAADVDFPNTKILQILCREYGDSTELVPPTLTNSTFLASEAYSFNVAIFSYEKYIAEIGVSSSDLLDFPTFGGAVRSSASIQLLLHSDDLDTTIPLSLTGLFQDPLTITMGGSVTNLSAPLSLIPPFILPFLPQIDINFEVPLSTGNLFTGNGDIFFYQAIRAHLSLARPFTRDHILKAGFPIGFSNDPTFSLKLKGPTIADLEVSIVDYGFGEQQDFPLQVGISNNTDAPMQCSIIDPAFDPPTEPLAVYLGHGAILFQWKEPDYLGRIFYEISGSESPTTGFTVVANNLIGNRFLLRNAPPNTLLYFKIQAVYNIGVTTYFRSEAVDFKRGIRNPSLYRMRVRAVTDSRLAAGAIFTQIDHATGTLIAFRNNTLVIME